jgi:hypothetical protein
MQYINALSKSFTKSGIIKLNYDLTNKTSCLTLCYNATYATTTTISSINSNCSVGSYYLLMGASIIG